MAKLKYLSPESLAKSRDQGRKNRAWKMKALALFGQFMTTNTSKKGFPHDDRHRHTRADNR